MADSNDIQSQITLVQADLSKWSAELMRLNGVLATAKGRVKNATQRAIKNAEQYVQDLTRRLRNLDADLSKAMKVEVKEKDNIILAEKGINQRGDNLKAVIQGATDITKSIMGSGLVTNPNPLVTLDKRKETAEPLEGEDAPGIFKSIKPTTMLIIGGAIIVLLLMFKKK